MFDIFRKQGWLAPAWPLLVMFGFMFVVWLFANAIRACIYKCNPSFKIGNIEVTQEIDTYFDSLNDDDRNWSIKEEENARNNLKGMKILTDEAFEELTLSTGASGKCLQGVHSYDILANPLYLDDFQYVSAAIENRNEYIIDDDSDEDNDAAQSDLVRVALNLAYLPEETAKKFRFDKRAMLDMFSGQLGALFKSKFNM